MFLKINFICLQNLRLDSELFCFSSCLQKIVIDDIFPGDTVNTASRMESSSESNRIQVSGYSANKLKKLGYKVTFRGLVTVKVRAEKRRNCAVSHFSLLNRV